MKLPKDPYMLLSVVNTKLRDDFPSLDELCASLDIDLKTLEATLETAGFKYDATTNQFK